MKPATHIALRSGVSLDAIYGFLDEIDLVQLIGVEGDEEPNTAASSDCGFDPGTS